MSVSCFSLVSVLKEVQFATQPLLHMLDKRADVQKITKMQRQLYLKQKVTILANERTILVEALDPKKQIRVTQSLDSTQQIPSVSLSDFLTRFCKVRRSSHQKLVTSTRTQLEKGMVQVIDGVYLQTMLKVFQPTRRIYKKFYGKIKPAVHIKMIATS